MLKATLAKEGERPHLFWDFLFYALFGVVITSSVGVAGILLVFSFLVVPALISLLLACTLRYQLILGWVLGVLLCLVGMAISYKLDLPAGAVLVVVFTAVPILALPWLTRLKTLGHETGHFK